MARDYYDESKDKKKKNNKEDAFSPRSLGQQQKGSTVDKTQTGSTTTSQSSSSSNSTNNVIERSSRSTFMGGGSRVSSNPTTSSRSTAPNEQPVQRTESRVKSAADKRAAVTQKRYSEPIGPSTQRTDTRRSLLDRADDFFRTFTDKSNEWEKNNVPERMTPERRTQIDTKNRTAAQNVSQRYQDRMGISDEDKALADYTAGVIKRKALGYAKTASKAVQTNEGKKFSGRWAQEDPEFARHISSHDFAQRADKAFNDYSAQQEKTQKRLTQIENNTSEAGRIALQAYGSGIEMGIDRLAGPLWAASMFASVYGNQRGNALAEGATDEQDARAAFLSAGLEVATEYMFRPAVGIASKFGGPHSLDFASKLASRVSGKLTGRAAKLADIGIRTLGSMAEENVEELVGWIADPYLQNAAYKNELQKTREEQAHADYNEMQSAFWSQFGTEEEAQEAALHVNSDDFVNELTETYRSSGASEEEAKRMAKIMQKYFLAHFDNDEKAAEEAEEAMDAFVVGDVKAHHSWKELAETFASTSLLTGVTGGASAYSTYQMGNQILNSPNGKIKVEDYSNLVQNFDEENTKEAKGIKETIKNGDTPTGTQVYQVASQATEVMSELDQKNTASNQVKDRRMKSEGLTVSPVVMTPYGPRMNEMTEQAYQASYEKTQGVIRGIRKHGVDAGLDEYVLTDRETMNKASHLVAAFETGTITAEEIATELTVDHPEMRTIFEMATGVDLSQYDVQKDGGFYNEVDAVKSNRAMLDGLLAKSSDNYVQMAQAEQKQWENRTRGEVHKAMTNSFGAMGNLAMHPVLKTADTTDQGKYMLTARMAQRVYDYARRTDDEWNDIKRSLKRISRSVDMDAMKLVYDAAKYDKQVSETPYYGRTVESGTAMGFAKGISSDAMERGTFVNESNRELDGDEDEAYTSVAFQTGLNIRLVPAEQLEQVKKDEKGNIVLDDDGNEIKISTNGKYDRKTGTIYLADSNSFGDNINIALSHEMTHHLAVFAPEAYMALSNYVMDRWYKLSPESYSQSIKNIQKLYKSVGQDLSEEEALEEIIADATRDFWNDPEFVERFTTDNEPSIIRKVINAIKDVISKIRSILSLGNVSEDYEHYLWNILGSYTEAEKLWLNAYKEAQARASEKAVDDWQDKANRQNSTRHSVPNYTQEEMDAHRQELINDAIASYGEAWTDDYEESGYVFPNGKMLKMGAYGQRGEDHALAGLAYDDVGYDTYFSPKAESQKRFINEGNIRWMPENGWVNFGTKVEPTPEQYQWLEDAVYDYGVAMIEFTDDNDNTVDYKEYDVESESADEVVNDVKRFYRNGKIGGSQLSQFRYSITSEMKEELNDSGVDITESGTAVKYSLASWTETDQDALLERLVKAGFEEDAAKRWIGNVNSVASLIYSDMARLNYEADQYQDALKPNSEYYYTLDLSTLCQKRRLYQGTYNAIMHHLVNKALHPEDTVRLREIMESMNKETPCGICYEESRKKNEGKFAEIWLNGDSDAKWNQKLKAYNKALKEYPQKLADYEALDEKAKKKKRQPKEPQKPVRWMGYANMKHTDPYIPTLDDVTTTDGRARLRKEHPEALEDYLEYQKGRGSANPKVSFTHTDYRGDILRMTKTDIANVKHIGGLRIQSFSDFETVHVIDMMQAIMDMAAMNLTSQAYTKVPAFADIFGGTNVKINLSLIQKMENGEPVYEEYKDEKTGEVKKRLVFDAKEGIDPKEAFRIREKYSKHVGTILVGVSRQQILDAWNDPRVDMVIPFHRSGWSLEEFERLGIKGYEDFQDYQSERYFDPKSKDWISLKDAKMEGIYSADYWDYSKTGKENAKAYLKLCAEKHYRPVFYNFLHDNGDGTWSLPTMEQDGYTADGYWKSLIDFKMYDNEGVGSPQEEVQPIFDMDVAEKVMADYEGNADTLPVAEDVVEAYLKDYKKRHPRAKIDYGKDSRLSIAVDMDDAYMDAVNSGNMEEAQRLVDEAARAAGMRVAHRYHGTMNAGFTVFDKAYAKVGGNSGAGFYFSTEEDDSANHYADVEGADNYYKWSELAEAIWDTGELPNGEEVEGIESYEDAVQFAKDYLNRSPGTFDVYLNYKNPYVRNFRQSTDILPSLYDDFDESLIDRNDYDDEDDYYDAVRDAEYEHIYQKINDAVYGAYYDLDNFYEIIDSVDLGTVVNNIFNDVADYERLTWDDIAHAVGTDNGWIEVIRDDWSQSATADIEFVRAIVENFGYDAIEDKEVSSKFGQLSREMMTDTEHIIVFKPEQIKLSDPVTYAEDGSIIPLSERFDPNNNDIRYSLPTTDADGKVLTDGQMEYFQNSQARDEQGRLVPVYHTTDEGGFTVFDPAQSEDHRSLFFTDDLNMSKSYFNREDLWRGEEGEILDAYNLPAEPTKGTYAVYLNFENPMIVDGMGHNWDDIPYGGQAVQVRNASLSLVPEWDMTEDGDPLLSGYTLDVSWDYLTDDNEWETKQISNSFDNPNPEEMEWFPKEAIEDYVASEGLSKSFFKEMASNAEEEEMDGSISYQSEDDEEATIYDTAYTTRDISKIAFSEGHDSVIIRNVKDYGGFGYGNAPHDIYIAFSSNQVKDIHNENPTENPDIRYSIPPEDEAMSYEAHEYIYDDSPEALEYYETIIEQMSKEDLSDGFINHPMQIYLENMRKYGKADEKARKGKSGAVKYRNDRDFTSAFFDGLTWYDTGMKFDDPVLEEGRTRMAKSRNDFFNSNRAKWNQMWETNGEVLDVRSIRKPVKQLVMDTMRLAYTNTKYKNDIVNMTLIDMRMAYWYAQRGRIDVADALLWHTANRMVTSVKYIEDDTEFKRYKEIRDFIRHTNISMSEEYWADEQFRHFRKKHFGKLNITQGLITNVDKVYQELEERWPDIFNEEQREKVGLVGNIKNFGDNNGDLLTHIGYVVDQNLTPFIEAYSSEEAAALTESIASSLLDIMQENGEALQSKADRYVEQINAMKTRHAEALRKVREQRDKKVNLANEKLKTYKENERAKKTHTKYFKSIQKNYDKLKDRLLSNTADKNIPEQYKKDLAKVLASFDLQTTGSKKWEERTGRQSKKSIKMAALKTALNNIEEKTDEFYVSDAITDIMEGLLGKNVGQGPNRSIEGLAIDELTIGELERIDKLLKALVHEFNTYKYIKINAKKQQTADIGKAQVEDALAHAEKYGAKKDFYSYLGLFDNIVNLDEMTAAYMFRKIDPNNVGMGLMFRELRRSFDHYVRNMAQLNQWMDEILEPYQNSGKGLNKYGADQIEQWRSFNYTQTFNLENGTVRLTPAQMMSVYCLAKRTQAYNHMTGAGIVVAPASFDAKMISDVKKKANTALPVKLTDADIKKIETALTPEQIQVAEQLQKLMADKMAAWGNEASMNVLGIELFGEPDYFPIKSDKAGLISDLDENQFVEAIRNFGFTKAVQPGAKNAIMVDDIFKIVAEHCNNMNLYNSYSESINDFMKVYNYRDFREDGSEYTVKQAIAHAYSQKATTFIMRFMKDLNGNVSGAETGISRMYNTLLSNAKKASVFANGRVALQQPTAITRAFAVIDPKYLKGVKIEKGAMKEMFEHCPIALWKSWGYYDIQMGRTIEDIMMNKGSLLEDVETWAYGALDNVTWTAIWQMVKAEMKDTHPDVKEGTDEYWDLCNERMSEIVDLTQVVDSPMHRSHGMRSKNFLEKTATAFMAEPTLTFNMVKDGVSRAREAWKAGNKAEAGKIFGRTMSVFLLQAATVSAMAAIWDAIRGKNSDDDDDESKLRLWWINALENFKGELNILNKIYFVKDVSSLFEGYGVNNLALQGWKSIADGWAQFFGTRNVYSSKSWYENLFGGIGSILGVPIGTVLKDAKAIYNLFGLDWKVVNDLGEYLDEMALEPKDEKGSIASLFLSILDGKKNDETQESEADDGSLMDGIARKLGYKKIGSSADSMTESGDNETETSEMSEDEYRDSLSDNLTEEQKDEIVKAYKRRTKKKAKEGGDAASEESAVRDKKDMLFDAEKAAAGYEGEERNKEIWKSVSKGYKEHIAEGDYGYIYKMRDVVDQMGGDLDYFDQQVIASSKTALKKTIEPGGADTESEMVAQQNIRMFLERNGVSQEDISAMVYESASAKDLKVAFRLNDEKAIIASTNALLRAGLTMTDYERIFTNRNRIDLKKYNGKYKDRLKSTGNFVWPTQGTITSHFGYRDAPTAGASSNHPAIDIGAPQGTAVVAADGGIVISAGANGGYGNSVGIKHDNGMVTWYNHLYDWNVKEGDTVAQGQQIGQVGSTGISTGPHLDFKIVDTNGNPVDPEKYLS